MATRAYPKECDIRKAVVLRADQFSKLTGTSRTKIGIQAVSDGAFVGQVENGRNFTISLYRQFMDWLDANWPRPVRRAAKRGSA